MNHPCVYSGFNLVDLSLILNENNTIQDIVDFLINMVMDTNDIVKFTKEEEKANAEPPIQEESKDRGQVGVAEQSDESIEDLRVIKDLRVRTIAAPQEESKEINQQE